MNDFNKDKYIAHYTSMEATMRILENHSIRLSHKSNTNDLYENNENWFFNEQYLGNINHENRHKCENIKIRIENEINKRIQLFCTIGYQNNRKLYNRPRAWAQYGDNHNGACLIFNKDKLIKNFENNNIIKFLHKKIKYIDWIDMIDTQESNKYTNDLEGLSKLLDSPELLFEEVDKRDFLNKKLFKKDIDWETENEYRFLAFSKVIDNIYIDYGDSLEAIVLGSNINYRLRHCFEHDDVKIYQIKYNEYNKYEYTQIK